MKLDPAIMDAAIRAGHEIEALRAAGAASSTKTDGSIITEADLRAEAIICDAIRSADPETLIVAEEACSADRFPDALPDRFYLVDPLDGTREFASGRDEYTVNIALIVDGAPVAGIVAAPAIGEGFYAGDGQAWRFALEDGHWQTDAQVLRARQPGNGLAAVVSRSHATPETGRFLERFTVAEEHAYGSSLKFCRLAEGRADIYPRFGRTMEWDTAAADAILRAAGGHVVDCAGHPLRYGKCRGISADPFANPSFIAFGDWRHNDIASIKDAAAAVTG